MAKINYSLELQKELVRLYKDENKTLKEISKIHHISPTKIKELLIQNGITTLSVKPVKFTDDQKEKIIDLYENQLIGCDKIAKILKISTRKINQFLHEIGKINDVGKTHKYKCNSNYFELIDSEQKAYWLGVLYADGNIGKTQPTVTFSAKDKEWTIAFLNSLESTSTIHKEIHNIYKTEIWKARITDDKLHSDLIKYGCVPQKSLIITFPKLESSLIPHFIRGYFDGDGTVGLHKNSSKTNIYTFRSGFCCGSQKFLEELCKQLPTKHKNILCVNKQNNGSGKLYVISFSVNDSMLLYQYMYKDATIWLSRKKNIFDNFIKQKRSETIIKTP